jgi:prepilin-type N-terminal cleavage/methylation domain-containing protein
MNIFIKRNNKAGNERGFTLIESIVAIFILLIAIVMPMAVVARALFAANYAQDQITAVYLAQEGVELVRNARDNNVLGGSALWDQGSLSSCYGASGCYVDAIHSNNMINTCSGTCPYVQEDMSGGISWYGNDSDWGNTKYIRTIRLSKISDYEIKINSTVTWETRTVPRTVLVEDVITNWP